MDFHGKKRTFSVTENVPLTDGKTAAKNLSETGLPVFSSESEF